MEVATKSYVDGAYTVTITGTGNAITDIGLSGTTITATKGSSFAASTHTHSKADISDFPTEMTPSTHSHGSITNDGKIGTTSGLAVVTGTGGAVTTANLSVADPTASGTAITFIATASADSTGKLSVTKSTVRDASSSQSGVVSTGTQTFAGNKTFSNNVNVSGTTSVKSLNINGTTTATGTFTVSGTSITLSGTTTIKGGTTISGTTTISGATTISGNLTTSGSTVTMSASTSITLKANEIRLQNSAGNNTQAGTKGYITELTLGDGRYTRITEYNDDDLEIRGNSILLNTANMTQDVKAYSDTTTYTVGTPVWYNSYYYVCKEAITTAEAWTASHWTQMPLINKSVMIGGDTIPWQNNTYDLGSTTYKWKTVYAATFSGTANKATAANLTTTTNAVAYYSDAAGTFSSSSNLIFDPTNRILKVSSGTTEGDIYLGTTTTESIYVALNALGWVSSVTV